MTVGGAIHERELAKALITLGREKKTGILTVQGDEEIIGVSFLGGDVVSADALNQSLEEGLGEVLASRDLVRPEDFATLAAEHQAGGGRVLDLLIERSYVKRDELLEALRFHTYRLCRQVLHWRSGEFKFYRGDEVSYEEGIVPIPVEELLIKAAQDLGTQGPLAGVVPGSEMVYHRADGGARPNQTPLSPELIADLGNEALQLIDKIDGQRSVQELLRESGIEEFKGLLILNQLEEAGRIRSQAAAAVEPLVPQVATAEVKVAPARAPAMPAQAPTWIDSMRTRSATKPKVISEYPTWPSRLLAMVLAAGLITVVVTQPRHLFLPFPGQRNLRQGLENLQYAAIYLKIDRSAETFFLLEGRFPERLHDLVERGFLQPSDVFDPSDKLLDYSALAAGYLLHPNRGEETSTIASRAETITGNFLLDPEFVVPEMADRPPLVLLD